MGKFFPTCQETARRISLAHDGSLSAGQRLGMWLHLSSCTFCRRFMKQVRFLHEALRRYPDHVEPFEPEPLSLEIKARIKQALKE